MKPTEFKSVGFIFETKILRLNHELNFSRYSVG